MDVFCPSRMRLARMRRGYTVTETAELLGLSRVTVSGFESGRVCPAEHTIEVLARVLQFPVAFFTSGEVELIDPVESDTRRRYASSVASFRALRSISARDRDRALAAGAIAVEIAKEFARHLRLPSLSVPDLTGQDPETAAALVRSEWGLGHGPIVDLVGHLESHGVRLFWLVDECREVDAFAFWASATPFVLLCNDRTGERIRFDGGHELAHLVLHRHGDQCGREAENDANRFASALLMPREQFLLECPRHVDLNTLLPLKRRWGVSLAAAVRRSFDVGLISEWQYRSLCIEISQRGRLNEPHAMPPEQSLLIPKAFDALRARGMRPQGLASALAIPWPDFSGLVGLSASQAGSGDIAPPPTLRLVQGGR